MTFYAVIDTNVLVSALLSGHPDAATVLVVDQIFDGLIIPVFSEEILAEYNDVLRREKFGFSADLIEMLLTTIEKYGRKICPISTGEVLPDKKDLPFYEAAAADKHRITYLVTGNQKHFPNRPFIVSAREFLEILDIKKGK